MTRCDICGKEDSNLVDLLESYKTPEIKQVCNGCASVLTKKKCDILSVTARMTSQWLRLFMETLRAQKQKEDVILGVSFKVDRIDEGVGARFQGMPRDRNPHPAGSHEWNCWNFGWDAVDHRSKPLP